MLWFSFCFFAGQLEECLLLAVQSSSSPPPSIFFFMPETSAVPTGLDLMSEHGKVFCGMEGGMESEGQ